MFADQVRVLLLLLSASSRKYLFQFMKEIMSWSSLMINRENNVSWRGSSANCVLFDDNQPDIERHDFTKYCDCRYCQYWDHYEIYMEKDEYINEIWI